MRTLDRTGQKFNFLTAIRRVGTTKDKGQNSLWECQCVCGSKKIYQISPLKAGTTKSCGCMKSKLISTSRTTHGMDGTTTYRIWIGMRTRCENPNSPSYPRYGGRGITVCERWGDFEAFMADMGKRPAGLSLDRIDNDAGYSPENCRWSSRREQQNNRYVNVKITYHGLVKTAAEWAREFQMPVYLIYARHKRGWRADEIFGANTCDTTAAIAGFVAHMYS